MSLDPAPPPVPVDSRADSVSPTLDGSWDARLADAFAVLLGRSLEEYDPGAVYAASVDGNLMDETAFLRDAAWVRPTALSGVEPVVWECVLSDGESERPWVYDASASVFEFWPERRTALPQDFTAALDTVCFARGLLRGADLATLVERYGVDLTNPALADTWSVAFPRLASDGTLLDALRAALATGNGPGDLLALTAEVDEEWEKDLAAIEPPALRAHLGYFCSDGDEGLMPLSETELTAGVLDDEGCVAVAAWEDGHGQLDIRIVRLSAHVAGPQLFLLPIAD